MVAFDSGDLSGDSSSETNDFTPAGIGDFTNKFVEDFFNVFDDLDNGEEEFNTDCWHMVRPVIDHLQKKLMAT